VTRAGPAPLSVKGVCLDAGGRVLVCRNWRREWELPGGRPSLGEELPASIEPPAGPRHLVKVRASQINGCAFCLDMHWLDARADGESEVRLYSLDAWRESALYSDGERAALALCEAMTRLDDGHVPDAVWEAAAAHFDEEELAELVFAIAAINTWNRLMIASRAQPGHYTPGMFA
jgi:AhpD family alkylhydroperoxidase